MLAGRDTLFTVARVPEEAGGRAARIASASFSSDSTAIAMRLVGPVPSVVVWPRLRQAAQVVRTFPGGVVMTVDWSPAGRLLAFEGRDADGGAQAGIFDVEAGLVGRHAALRWLERRGQSVRFQSWVGPGRARFLVGPEEGGLAYVWDVPSGIFVLESHMAVLASQPPPGAPQRSGVFSLDLGGDPTPETVALFRTLEGVPGAYVLVDAGPGGVRGTATVPLVPAGAVGVADWKETTRGADLYQIAEIGGRPTLLLALPSESRFLAVGLFQLAAAGGLEPVTLAGPAGAAPAVFPEGVVGDETRQIGLADLDGDGAEEVVAATGRREAGVLRWSVEVYRWDGARLAPAPALAPAAMERIERLVGGR